MFSCTMTFPGTELFECTKVLFSKPFLAKILNSCNWKFVISHLWNTSYQKCLGDPFYMLFKSGVNLPVSKLLFCKKLQALHLKPSIMSLDSECLASNFLPLIMTANFVNEIKIFKHHTSTCSLLSERKLTYLLPYGLWQHQIVVEMLALFKFTV